MKKIVALMLILIFCISAMTINVAAYSTGDITVGIDRTWVERDQYGTIEAYQDGTLLWTHRTEFVALSELETISNVHVRGDSAYFVAGGILYALDLYTGQIKWQDGNNGAGNRFAFDEKGNIYVSGYYGPNVSVYNPEGELLYRDESAGYGWVTNLQIEGNLLTISYDLGYNSGIGTKEMNITGFLPEETIAIDDSIAHEPEKVPEEEPEKPDGISVMLNGKKLEFDQPPIVEKDRTLVPLRGIFEALGATVSWDDVAQMVTSIKDETTVQLVIGEVMMYKNGKPVPLDVAPKLVGARTLVPVRAVSEAFGCDVGWDEKTQTVVISQE